MKFNDKELAIMLTGLRMLQASIRPAEYFEKVGWTEKELYEALNDILTDGGKFKTPTVAAIDKLCAKLNTSERTVSDLRISSL